MTQYENLSDISTFYHLRHGKKKVYALKTKAKEKLLGARVVALTSATLMVLASALLPISAVRAESTATPKPPLKVVVFDGPSVDHDGVWMAIKEGFYKKAGLEVQTRIFPSGTVAFQSFAAGAGDIMMGGELDALNHWHHNAPYYRIILPMDRDSGSYIAYVRNDIKTAADLKGKTIGVLENSTGQWFLSEYLTKNGISKSDVTVRNLSNSVLPVALCKGDIQAFFSWQPRGARTEEICGKDVHLLSDAKGYINGYNLAGARITWLNTPKGHDIAMRFVRATAEGSKFAASHLSDVAAYAKRVFGMTKADVESQYKFLNRKLAFDKVFFSDFCELSTWAQGQGMFEDKTNLSNFIWTDGIKAVDPALVTAAPPPC